MGRDLEGRAINKGKDGHSLSGRKEGNKQVVGENRAALFPQNCRIDSYSNERPFAVEIEALEHAVPCHSILCLAVTATERQFFFSFPFPFIALKCDSI